MFIILLIFLLSNFASAQTKIDSLEKLLSTSEKITKVEILSEISFEYLKIGDDKNSEKYYKKTYDYSLSIGYKIGCLIAEQNKADVDVFREQFDEADSIYNTLLNEFRKLNDKKREAFVLNDIGSLKLRISDNVNAMKYFQEALGIFQSLDLKIGLIICYGNIGNLHENFGDYAKALDLYIQQLEVSEATNDKEAIGVALENIGDIQKSMGNTEKALEYYDKSLKIFQDINDLEGIGILNINIGEIAISNKEFEKAHQHFELAMEVLESIGSKSNVAYINNKLGFLHREKKEFKEALEHFQTALRISEESEEKGDIAYTYFEFGGYYTAINSYRQALESYNKSLEMSVEVMDFELIRDNYKGLSEAYYRLDDTKNAYKYLKLYYQSNDSLINQTTLKKLNDLNTLSEINDKEQDIELLRKESEVKDLKINRQWIFTISFIILALLSSIIAIIAYKKSVFEKKANKILEEKKKELVISNNAKEKMLSVISHDLRGPLGNILTALNIITDENNEINSRDSNIMLRQIKSSAQSTYELLENLLNWANSQSDKIMFSPELDSIVPLIKETIKIYITNAEVKSIRFISQVSESHIAYFDKNMVRVILRNLISNAIKFSEKNSDIIISTEYEGDFLQISVKDTGKGIDKDLLDRIFLNYKANISCGIQSDSGAGLGLTLCTEFAEKNGGKIFAQSDKDNEITFGFTLPRGQ